MLTTSSGWTGKVTAPYRQMNYGLEISFSQATASGVNYFTIGTSTIGGNDIIKSGGSFVSFYDKYQYTDYSKYVMSINIKRTLGQYPYGFYMAQADVELDNSTNLFTPGYDATIGSGILPNRPMKISMGFGGETLTKFVGFAGQPDITVRDSVATFHAYDAMNYAAGFVSQASGSKVNYYSTDIMAALYGEMGFGLNQYVFDSSLQRPIGYIATYNQKAGDIFQSLAEAEQGLVFTDENGIGRFWNRQHFTTTSGTAAFSLSFANAEDLQYENTPIINDVIVKANPRATVTNAKVWDLTGTITLLPNQQTLYIAKFTDEDGDLPVTDVTAPLPISIATNSYYSVNNQSDGSGSDMSSYVNVVSAYSYGNQYWITFANNSSTTAYITAMALWAVAAKVSEHIEQRYFDQTSINSYGRNPANNGDPITITNDYIQDNSTANSLARTLVYEYKDARKRYRVPVAVNSDPSLQIGDFGKLTINSTGEVKNVWIVGIEDTLTRDKKYTQTLELEERSIQTYFTIGTSRIGGSDTIAP